MHARRSGWAGRPSREALRRSHPRASPRGLLGYVVGTLVAAFGAPVAALVVYGLLGDLLPVQPPAQPAAPARRSGLEPGRLSGPRRRRGGLGSQMRTRVPWPGQDSSVAWPPCASAMAWTIDRPRPLPPRLAERRGRSGRPAPRPVRGAVEPVEGPGRVLARTCPGPASATSSTTPPRDRGQPHRDRGAAAGVCARTLPSRLASTWRIRASSTTATSRGGASARTGRSGSTADGVGDRVPHQPGQVGLGQVERGGAVQPGQLEQFGHERAHPLRLLLDPAHRVRQLIGAERALPVQLGVAADGGQRGAQLVRGVGGELAHLLLRAQPRAERLLDPVEHGVDGRRRAGPPRCCRPRRAPAR